MWWRIQSYKTFSEMSARNLLFQRRKQNAFGCSDLTRMVDGGGDSARGVRVEALMPGVSRDSRQPTGSNVFLSDFLARLPWSIILYPPRPAIRQSRRGFIAPTATEITSHTRTSIASGTHRIRCWRPPTTIDSGCAYNPAMGLLDTSSRVSCLGIRLLRRACLLNH